MMSTLRCGRGAQWRCLGNLSDPVQRAALCRQLVDDNTCGWLKVQLPDRTNAADRQEFVHRFAVLSLASERGVRLKSSSRAGAEHRTTRAATRTNIPSEPKTTRQLETERAGFHCAEPDARLITPVLAERPAAMVPNRGPRGLLRMEGRPTNLGRPGIAPQCRERQHPGSTIMQPCNDGCNDKCVQYKWHV